ncbi:hypothetical protein B9Z55_024994 [Caenorhabditis nigoni]|nr:hypothetical protein B9Z55_024994 [Caenorhabditis nigoni]
MFSPRGRARTGGDFAADPDSSCICMPIKFWFIMLALIHLCLVIISLSVKFYYIFEVIFKFSDTLNTLNLQTIIVVLSLFIICLPDIFAVFVHYLIQLIFWFVTAIIYLVVLIKEAEKEADAGRITLFLLYITLCLTYAIIYFRLVVAGR